MSLEHLMQDWAENASEAAYPNLRNRLTHAYAPQIGNTGRYLFNYAGKYEKATLTTDMSWNGSTIGTCLSNGGTGYVTLPALALASRHTVLVWVMRLGASTNQIIGFDNQAAEDRRYRINVGSSGTPPNAIIGNSFASFNMGIATTLGSWNLLAVSYDGTNAAPYVNGKAGTAVARGWTTGTATNPRICSAGGASPSVTFNGRFGPLYVYSRALSAAEIQMIYKMPYAPLIRKPRSTSFIVAAAPATSVPKFMHHYKVRRTA